MHCHARDYVLKGTTAFTQIPVLDRSCMLWNVHFVLNRRTEQTIARSSLNVKACDWYRFSSPQSVKCPVFVPGHISLSGVLLSFSRASASISTGQQIRQWVRLQSYLYFVCRRLLHTMIHSKNWCRKTILVYKRAPLRIISFTEKAAIV